MDVQTWQDDVFPPVDGIYRAQNVFIDGNSNLVLHATREDGEYYGGKLRGNWRGMINTTWEARIKLDCLYPGLWPSFWTVNEDPQPDGEVDLFEWYGNGEWAPGTTVHAASNGKTWEGKSIPGMVDGGWHTWQMRWQEDGFKFLRDTSTARSRISASRRSPSTSSGRLPTICGGRSTTPATGWRRCSRSRSAGSAQAIPPQVPSRARCSSTTSGSGSDHLSALIT